MNRLLLKAWNKLLLTKSYLSGMAKDQLEIRRYYFMLGSREFYMLLMNRLEKTPSPDTVTDADMELMSNLHHELLEFFGNEKPKEQEITH